MLVGPAGRPVSPGRRRLLAFLGVLLTPGVVRAESHVSLGPALIFAAERGDLARVRQLLRDGANPDAHDAAGNTALIFAARDGRLDMVRALLDHGASADWIDGEGVTPLILAAFKNHPAIAELLLERGASPARHDQWGRNALDYALRRGADDAIARLLQGF